MTGLHHPAAAPDRHPGHSRAVRGETAGTRAAIVIVCRESRVREILHRELSKRYGGDYQIVACGRPAHSRVRHGSVKRVASAVAEGAVTIPLVHHHLHRRRRTSRHEPITPSPVSAPRDRDSVSGLVNAPAPTEHNVIATGRLGGRK